MPPGVLVDMAAEAMVDMGGSTVGAWAGPETVKSRNDRDASVRSDDVAANVLWEP